MNFAPRQIRRNEKAPSFRNIRKTFLFPTFHSGHIEFRSKTKRLFLFVARAQRQQKKRTKFSARSLVFAIDQDADQRRGY
jgi:hypothetical protein